MPKFRVYGNFTATKFLGVYEADTEEDAINQALSSEDNSASLCHHCADELELDDWTAHSATAEKDED